MIGMPLGMLVLLGAGCGTRDTSPALATPAFEQPAALPPIPGGPAAPPRTTDAIPTLPLPGTNIVTPTLPPIPGIATPPAPATHPAPATPTPQPRTIAVTAKTWAFEPSTIRLTKGETVILEVTSVDVDHGLLIPALNVSEKLTPGSTTRITVMPQEIGTFPMICNVFCGAGHKDMRGSIVVE